MDYVKDLIKFIENSPSGYHAVRNAMDMLSQKPNYRKNAVKCGSSHMYFKQAKAGAALVAVDIGENAAASGYPMHIVSAHVDSPWFLIDGDEFIDSENTLQLPVRKYGGMLPETWMDRPLTLAGRVALKSGNRTEYRLFHLKDKVFIIPNMCRHFAKYMKADVPVHPVYGESEGKLRSIRQLLAAELSVAADSISDYTINTVCMEKACVWGDNKEFLSSGRLDDLACVYTALAAFSASHNPDAINVLYLCDNEEIGSKTAVGAFGSFLRNSLEKLADRLGFSLEESMKRSFMISADNAQCCHPDHSYIYNPEHKIYMNQGLSAKMSEKYSSTEETLQIFADICEHAKQPHQLYYNREDIPGGSTVGKIIKEKLKIDSVDVGIPQLAMHSCYETMGTRDIQSTVEIFKYFYTRFEKKL